MTGGRNVAVLGGGPAGLAVGRLLRTRRPDWSVTVYERQPPTATFGYGVGLSTAALARLRDTDPVLCDALEAAALSVDTWTVRRDGESLSARNQHGLGIARTQLLGILAEHARQAGVGIEVGRHVTVADVADADVVIAADGVGSLTRAVLADELGASIVHGDLAYIWCGAPLQLDAMTLSLARSPYGPIAAHVMPYDTSAVTFQCDMTASSLTAAGLGLEDEAYLDASIALLQDRFADLLGGHDLEVKRGYWSTFATVTCERWSHGNVVLIGDAAHTAHYTVGSGTGLGVEDAVELADRLASEPDVETAFATYELARRPRVARVQERAARSHRWWTTLADRFDLPLPQFLVSYLVRTGAVTLPMLSTANSTLLDSCVSGLGTASAPDLAATILAQPYQHNGSSRGTRVVDSNDLDGHVVTVPIEGAPASAAGLRTVASDIAGGISPDTTHIRLLGGPGRDSLLDRLELAEQLRVHSNISTVVVAPADLRDDLALGVLTERTDLVEMTA